MAVSGLYFVYWLSASILSWEIVDPFRDSSNQWEHFILWGILWTAIFTVIGGLAGNDDEPR
jgi:hypothetical protein